MDKKEANAPTLAKPMESQVQKNVRRKAESEEVLKMLAGVKYLLSTQLLREDAAVCAICCSDNAAKAVQFRSHPTIAHPAQVVLTADSTARTQALRTAWNQAGSPGHIALVDFDPQGISRTLDRCAA